jgi:hypothetical protein
MRSAGIRASPLLRIPSIQGSRQRDNLLAA